MDPELVKDWKRAHGQIYGVTLGGIDYVFRALTFAEWDDLQLSETDTVDTEDDIVALAVLSPAGGPPATALAGVITTLADRIMEVSGLSSPKVMRATLEDKRALLANDVRTMMKAFVLASMPSYREEELDALNFDQLARKVALAETVMKVQQTSVGIEHDVRVDVIDPEEEALAHEVAKQKHAAAKKPGTAGYDDPIAQRLRTALG